MAPLVVFPDTVAMAINDLRAELAAHGFDVPVSDTVPNPRPARLVKVQRAGGPNADAFRDAPLLIVECWAPQPSQAHALAQMAWAITRAWAGRVVRGVNVYRVNTAGGPADLPDPVANVPRFTFSVELIVRGATP